MSALHLPDQDRRAHSRSASLQFPTDSARPRAIPARHGTREVHDDLRRLQALGVTEIFFDMNRFGVDPGEQLRRIDRLRAAAG
jgi:hypothetical protein